MVTNNYKRIWSDLAVPPGELLEEELAAVGMTQQELAMRTGRPVQVINEIIRGKKAITHDTALELEKVLGIPAHVWVNLESTYQLTQAKNREREALRNQEEWLSEFPIKELEKRGWIEKYSDRSETVRALLEFLGVASFQAWRQTIVGLRVSEKSKVSLGALAVWLRRGEIAGRESPTEVYDETKFRQALEGIRTLTAEFADTLAWSVTCVLKLRRLCANAGVAIVFVHELPKSGANAVTRWLAPTKGLIQMGLRWTWSDVFWFRFFHQAHHIIGHSIRPKYIEGIDGDSEEEAKADKFARDFLISPVAWSEFMNRQSHDATDIRAFASRMGIHPGIVVGRMQHEGIVPYNQFTGLKVRFVWRDTQRSSEAESAFQVELGSSTERRQEGQPWPKPTLGKR